LIGVAAVVVVAECWDSWHYWYCCSLPLHLFVWIGSLLNMVDTVAASGVLHPHAIPCQHLLTKETKNNASNKNKS
jgi:hypothetical protein